MRLSIFITGVFIAYSINPDYAETSMGDLGHLTLFILLAFFVILDIVKD